MELYMIAPPTPHYTHIILKKYSYYSWYSCLNYVFTFIIILCCYNFFCCTALYNIDLYSRGSRSVYSLYNTTAYMSSSPVKMAAAV